MLELAVLHGELARRGERVEGGGDLGLGLGLPVKGVLELRATHALLHEEGVEREARLLCLLGDLRLERLAGLGDVR